MSNDVAIKVENLSKRYRIGAREKQADTLRERIENLIASPFDYLRSTIRGPSEEETLWALKDVSFEVRHGEVLGLIGPNGAGKTTLLKILSRITEPTMGMAEIDGRVGSLLEVGTGFHPELTGRENIYMNGAILGMKRAEIKKKFDEIVDFADIEKFVDTPVKRYSSGMYVRLAFAVAANLEPEILLVDEVLAVGDAAFQQKCFGKMDEVGRSGRTVLLVSHNMASVQALCGTSILLQDGGICATGNTAEVIDTYISGRECDLNVPLHQRTRRTGSGIAKFVAIRLCNAKDKPVDSVLSGERVTFEMDFVAGDAARRRRAEFGLTVSTVIGERLFQCNTQSVNQQFDVAESRGRAVCSISKLPLLPGRYSVNINLTVDGQRADFVEKALQFDVHSGDFFGSGKLTSRDYGPFLTDYQWTLAAIDR